MSSLDTTGDVKLAVQTQSSMQNSGFNYMNLDFRKSSNTSYNKKLMNDLVDTFTKRNMEASIKDNVSQGSITLHVNWIN